eukprot:SAG11_NODE_857_length_6851_cov_2.438981_5_plen_184_part_00
MFPFLQLLRIWRQPSQNCGSLLYPESASRLLLIILLTVQTGLGPTLEFYTLVSRELQKAKLALWRSSEAIKPPSEGAEGADADVYITSKTGLFPRPLTTAPAAATTDYQGAASSAVSSGCSSRSVPRSSARSTSHTVSSVGSLSRFKMLGRLMAKALQDSRVSSSRFNDSHGSASTEKSFFSF